jgi:hypothetical protein
VRGLCDARSIAGTFSHYCAIDGAARLWCWGQNDEGQLGQSDTYPGRNALAPVEVLPSGGWLSVAPGQGHTCALRAPGALYCWGRNPDGQLGLGDGTPIQLRAPQRVGALDDWTLVSAGQDQSCALRRNGELHCWGSGASIPMATQRSPLRITADSDYDLVAVSTFSACARRRSGGLWCWGRNDEGQLGLGPAPSQSAPTLVSLDATVSAIASGRFHACVRASDGRVLCAGENNRGQLGLGDSARRGAFTAIP